MKIILGQINTTPRDFEGNFKQIADGVTYAIKENADLIVFPELAIPGYLTKDMIYEQDYVQRNLQYLQKTINLTTEFKTHVIVGYIDKNRTGVGKLFKNMMAVIQNGTIIATYQKHLLPTYDVFDEGRYYEPGKELTVIEICGKKFGICICEDQFNDKDEPDYDYANNPLESYRKLGVHNVISINSSPYVQGKDIARIEMLKRSSAISYEKGHENTYIYVNQIGGQDELVFDGNSFVVENGELKFKADNTKPYQIFECADSKFKYTIPIVSNAKTKVFDNLILGLKDYVTKSGFTDVVIGSSGGIDSALTLVLAVEALGPTHVHAVRMPSVFSSDHSKSDALQLHKNLKCNDYLVPIEHSQLLYHIIGNLWGNIPEKYNKVADENLQARLRGIVLMHFSNATGALTLTTGNKTELALGYCTLYGDTNGGFAPINDLYKSEIKQLCHYVNRHSELIPKNILEKPPSAELAPGQTDEASLLPYDVLDPIVKAYIEDYIRDFNKFKTYCGKDTYKQNELCPFLLAEENVRLKEWLGSKNAETDYYKMVNLIDKMEFKRRQAAPGIKISRVAFGSGRRIPIVKGN